MGCLEIWDQICDVQGRFGNEYGRPRGGGEVAVPLPDPKMDTLGAVRRSGAKQATGLRREVVRLPELVVYAECLSSVSANMLDKSIESAKLGLG